MLWCCWLGSRKGIQPVKKTEWWGAGLVICLERGGDLHMAQLMPLPLTVSCFTKIQIGFTFLLPAHLGCPGKRAVKWVCVLERERVSVNTCKLLLSDQISCLWYRSIACNVCVKKWHLLHLLVNEAMSYILSVPCGQSYSVVNSVRCCHCRWNHYAVWSGLHETWFQQETK